MKCIAGEVNNDALTSVNNASPSIRHTEFAMKQSKLTKNLKKDATIINYDTLVNNYEENVNLKCSSGFYLQVANPALLALAKQSSNSSSPLAIKDLLIHCTNSRISLDSHDLLVNHTYFFEVLDRPLGNLLGKVTVHCHVTSRLVQLQVSKLIGGIKAPIWFFDNVLKNTFDNEGIARKAYIDLANEDIINIPTNNDIKCDHCEKTYKTTTGTYKQSM